MKPIKRLYQIHPEDNVATALGDLVEGETVSVVNSYGGQAADLLLLCDVPQFFKVAVKPLQAGDPVLKWGQAIGTIPKGYANGTLDFDVRPGTIVHIANFVASTEFAQRWGDPIAFASTAIVRAARRGVLSPDGRPAQPLELGATRAEFKRGNPIFAGNVVFDGDLEAKLVPADLRGSPLGYALENIKDGGTLHLGAIVKSREYAYPGSKEEVDTVLNFYRFLKGRIHGIS